ncbi:dephospho-CoA kinase [Algivirga pacifica]|uniref:Dephospho-CoA kinase n=1 Tax=Algivirga pacifica TaxID=1162670 RepID=A0ABP9DAH8_9BACT
MQSKLQIGIAGGIGAGKSVVCNIFRALGVPVYDADQMAKTIMVIDQSLIMAIKQTFGEESYFPDGSLNRQYLAQQVFAKGERIKELNALVHPRLEAHYQQWANDALKEAPYVVKEAAILFQNGGYKQMDASILVTCPVEKRIQRVLKRDPQRSESQVREIIGKQMSEERQEALASLIVPNDGLQPILPTILYWDECFRKGIMTP